jgi:hypothetical protein
MQRISAAEGLTFLGFNLGHMLHARHYIKAQCVSCYSECCSFGAHLPLVSIHPHSQSWSVPDWTWDGCMKAGIHQGFLYCRRVMRRGTFTSSMAIGCLIL